MPQSRVTAARAIAVSIVEVCALASCQLAPPRDERRPSAWALSSERREGSVPLAVRRGALHERVMLTGELDAASAESLTVPRTPQWHLSVRWLAPNGSRVEPGDRVAELDNAAFAGDLADRRMALERARADLERQAALDEMGAADKAFEVERARIALEKARLSAQVSPDALARRTYEERQLAKERAEVALESARDVLQTHLQSSALERKVRQIAIDKAEREIEAAERAIRAAVVRAPSAGTVLIADHPGWRRRLEVGDNVWPGLALARLPDVSKLRVNAQLSDVDDGRVRAGMPATVVLDAYPERRFAGVVSELAPLAQEPSTGSRRRFFQARINLDETDLSLMRPGMSARVEVTTSRAEHELCAPRASIDLSASPARLHLESGHSVPIDVLACNLQECAFRTQPDAAPRVSEGTALRAAHRAKEGA